MPLHRPHKLNSRNFPESQYHRALKRHKCRVHERLRGGDAMFLQHHHEHLGVDDRTGAKQFPAGNLTQMDTACHAEVERRRKRAENG